MKLYRPLLILAFLPLAACTTGYNIRVDGIAGDTVSVGSGRYFIASNMQNIDESDLYFREFAALLDPPLQAIGLTAASGQEQADMVIYLNYGISGGENVYYSYERPYYQLIGGETVTWRETRTDSGGNKTVVTGTVHVPLQYHFVGTVREMETAVVYTGFFSLEARKAGKEAQKQPALWQLTVKCTSWDNDLRRLMPMMTDTAAPWFGKNTGRELSFTVAPKAARKP